MRRVVVSAIFFTALAAPSGAQTPQPFPGAGVRPPAPAAPTTRTPAPPESAASTPAPPAAQGAAPDANGPSAVVVGFSVFPGAQFLGGYDAGKGQHYYLYGVTAPYLEVVKWYQTQLRDRGDQVFAEPATHTFAQRFREESMAFPPGVTVKDWTTGGAKGFPNPKAGGQPPRFSVVIMIVPPPPPVAAQ